MEHKITREIFYFNWDLTKISETKKTTWETLTINKKILDLASFRIVTKSNISRENYTNVKKAYEIACKKYNNTTQPPHPPQAHGAPVLWKSVKRREHVGG